jgi:hypothetical protein
MLPHSVSLVVDDGQGAVVSFIHQVDCAFQDGVVGFEDPDRDFTPVAATCDGALDRNAGRGVAHVVCDLVDATEDVFVPGGRFGERVELGECGQIDHLEDSVDRATHG